MKSTVTLKLQFEQKLLAVFVIVFVIVAMLVAAVFDNNRVHNNAAVAVERTKGVLYNTEKVANSVKELESAIRGYVITGDSAFLSPCFAHNRTIGSGIQNLSALIQDDPLQQKRVDSLNFLAARMVNTASRTVALRNKNGQEAAQRFLQTKVGFHLAGRIDELIDRVEATEEALLSVRKQASDESNEGFFVFFFLLIAVLLITFVVSFVALRKNLKARRKAEELLRESKALLRAIVDNTSSLIYVKDARGRFTLVNKSFEKKYGLMCGEAIGKTSFDIVPATCAGKHTLNDQRVLRNGLLLETEEDGIIDGKLHQFYSVKFPLQKRDGKIYGVAGISTDITDLLTKKQVEKQKEIIETAVDAQEKERRHLSTELHDNINQLLASAKLMLDAAKTNPELHDICLRKCEEAIGEGITELRNLSHALAAPKFARDGFTSAVKDLAERINLSGKIKVQTSLCAEDEIEQLSEKAKIALYRIIQEQMNNTLKYAKAKGVQIELKSQNENVCLRIADDGVGFDPNKKAKGIGLRNIENRIAFFSGKMNLVSSPNRGCELQVELPMSSN